MFQNLKKILIFVVFEDYIIDFFHGRYYSDTIYTVLSDRLFSQLNHTATHFCLHFSVVTITSQIADWVPILQIFLKQNYVSSVTFCLIFLVLMPFSVFVRKKIRKKMKGVRGKGNKIKTKISFPEF